MTEPNQTATSVETDGSVGPAPVAPTPPAAQEAALGAAAAAADRPELPVAAAFAGGFLLAMLFKRLAR